MKVRSQNGNVYLPDTLFSMNCQKDQNMLINALNDYSKIAIKFIHILLKLSNTNLFFFNRKIEIVQYSTLIVDFFLILLFSNIKVKQCADLYDNFLESTTYLHFMYFLSVRMEYSKIHQ